MFKKLKRDKKVHFVILLMRRFFINLKCSEGGLQFLSSQHYRPQYIIIVALILETNTHSKNAH